MPASHSIDGQNLTLDAVDQAARNPLLRFELAPEARARMQRSRDWVEALVRRGEPVYGINTGFGALANERISEEDTRELQYKILQSHSVQRIGPISMLLGKKKKKFQQHWSSFII